MMREGKIAGCKIAGWKRAVLTALMAYAFVLQTVLVSLGGAAHAAETAGLQGILCQQDSQARPDRDPAKAHEGLCCTLSCHHQAGTGGLLPESVFMERLAPALLIARAPLAHSLSRSFSRVLPVGSRAPPRLA